MPRPACAAAGASRFNTDQASEAASARSWYSRGLNMKHSKARLRAELDPDHTLVTVSEPQAPPSAVCFIGSTLAMCCHATSGASGVLPRRTEVGTFGQRGRSLIRRGGCNARTSRWLASAKGSGLRNHDRFDRKFAQRTEPVTEHGV